ncbi:TPA: hypothetical protein QCY19_001984 [Bacillus luti]|nr:hypothetical protein [Bacillus luti]
MGVIFLFFGFIFVITVHVITHRIMDVNKKKLYVISLIFASICSFIPTTGENNSDFLYFGIPAENFIYYGGWEILFHPLGFFFNFILFYWILKLVLKRGQSFGREVKK